MDALDFEWDVAKEAANARKHGVRFREAETVFGDYGQYTVDDPDHSDDEDRELTLGATEKGRVIVVSHTKRGDAIRIISARKATREEIEVYQDVQEQRRQAAKDARAVDDPGDAG